MKLMELSYYSNKEILAVFEENSKRIRIIFNIIKKDNIIVVNSESNFFKNSDLTIEKIRKINNAVISFFESYEL